MGPLTNHAESHFLNTPKALKEAQSKKDVCACAFKGSTMVTGYQDGLVCHWAIEMSERGFITELIHPWIGHVNKINALVINGADVFSFSQDCTARVWSLQQNQCTRVFKFTDPVSCGLIDNERNMLFVGGWDRSVKAIDIVKNEVDRSFIGSREAIKCMHLYDKWLFVAGVDQVIRAYDLDSGKVKTFEGHSSWVLCMTTYVKFKEDGSVQNHWLLSGSDDNTVRVWDINTVKCLEELQGHKNGIVTLTFANGDLFTGSFDNYIICWSMADLENKIRESQTMLAEDLRSKKFEAFEAYMTLKGKRKKPSKGKGKKGKK